MDHKWIDTHAHLYVKEFADDRNEMIQRAIDVDVEMMFLPNIDQASIEGMLRLNEVFPKNCFPMIGLHPCDVKEDFQTVLSNMEPMLNAPKVKGVGETGIDLFWDKTFEKHQIEAFEHQIKWAKRYKLPIIIHSRAALDLTIALIEKHKDEKLNGIFHCFDGTLEQAKKIEELGFYMGIGGVLTFKKAEIRNIIVEIDLNYVVLETDSPFLTPVPYRGKRNESSYIPYIGAELAKLTRRSIDEIQAVTTRNAMKIFGVK